VISILPKCILFCWSQYSLAVPADGLRAVAGANNRLAVD
jgi:hypothetical protein